MQDILFKTDDAVFSYRIGGILIHEGKILLQKPKNDDGYAIPGGHVVFGETSCQALIREFSEEIHADIEILRPVFVGEIFFPWDHRPCHSISLFYLVKLKDPSQIKTEGVFPGFDELGGERYDLDFYWIPLEDLSRITVYPTTLQPMLANPPEGITHFLYRE